MKENKRKFLNTKYLPLIAVIVIALIAFLAFFLSPFGSIFKNGLGSNYAEDVARPIEQQLVESGAVKKCSTGDSGRGPDNQNPWYNAVFETGQSKDQAIAQVTELAKSHGFNLAQDTSPYDYITRLSGSIDQKGEFTDLQDGHKQLKFSIYSGGENLSCSGTELHYGPGNAAIVMTLSLPDFK